jgi:hypothetical protein
MSDAMPQHIHGGAVCCRYVSLHCHFPINCHLSLANKKPASCKKFGAGSPLFQVKIYQNCKNSKIINFDCLYSVCCYLFALQRQASVVTFQLIVIDK